MSELRCGTCGELEPEKWISIKDELPEVDTEVLLHLNDGLIRIASLENDKNWLVSQTYFIDWDDASHWIPLPAPPEAEVSKCACEFPDRDVVWGCEKEICKACGLDTGN